MRLAALINGYDDALRADLQRYYAIDLDHAMNGGHSAAHIAALVKYLPHDAAIYTVENLDAEWALTDVLLADIRNIFADFVYGMSDRRKRGKRPKRIGPSWMAGESMRKLEAQTMSVDELMAELNKDRR